MSDRPNKPRLTVRFLTSTVSHPKKTHIQTTFPAPTIPTITLLREAQDKTDSTPALVQGVAALFGLPSVHLGRVAGRLLCQDETAFFELQIQLGKAEKRKELH